MTSTVSIDEPLIRSHIDRAAAEVIRAMLSFLSTLCWWATRKSLSSAVSGPQIAGSVGFVGELQGIVYVHFDLACAQIGAGHLLGMNAAELAGADAQVVNGAVES